MKVNIPRVAGRFLILPGKTLSRIGNRVFPQRPEELPVAGICDIGFVFGGGRDDARAQRALELWRDKKIRRILVTGGNGPLTFVGGRTEADLAHDFLRINGVPESDILVENRSRNTLENVRFGLELLQQCGYDGRHLGFVVITHDFHIPRAVGLLWTALGDSRPSIYWSAVKSQDDQVSRETWRDSPEGRFWIIKEDLRLASCKLTGKIRYGIIRPQFR